MLLMPAWRGGGGAVGVKVAMVVPANSEKGLPTVSATYILSDGETGAPLAVLDGGELTARRTAAASALASGLVAARNSRRLLMVGTGRLAAHLVRAHATQRPIRHVAVWGRTSVKANALAESLRAEGLDAEATCDLASAVSDADIISCATLSREPLILGEWLRPGQHVDLVGAFTPDMRETDDRAIARSRVFVDTMDGAMAEAGDILIPIRAGTITADHIVGDLSDLVRGCCAGRREEDDITVFKSVGTALEDLVGAELAYERIADKVHA